MRWLVGWLSRPDRYVCSLWRRYAPFATFYLAKYAVFVLGTRTQEYSRIHEVQLVQHTMGERIELQTVHASLHLCLVNDIVTSAVMFACARKLALLLFILYFVASRRVASRRSKSTYANLYDGHNLARACTSQLLCNNSKKASTNMPP